MTAPLLEVEHLTIRFDGGVALGHCLLDAYRAFDGAEHA